MRRGHPVVSYALLSDVRFFNIDITDNHRNVCGVFHSWHILMFQSDVWITWKKLNHCWMSYSSGPWAPLSSGIPISSIILQMRLLFLRPKGTPSAIEPPGSKTSFWARARTRRSQSHLVVPVLKGSRSLALHIATSISHSQGWLRPSWFVRRKRQKFGELSGK